MKTKINKIFTHHIASDISLSAIFSVVTVIYRLRKRSARNFTNSELYLRSTRLYTSILSIYFYFQLDFRKFFRFH